MSVDIVNVGFDANVATSDTYVGDNIENSVETVSCIFCRKNISRTENDFEHHLGLLVFVKA